MSSASSENLLLAGAREVAERLRGAGFEAYLAGGCVRDTLRGEAPKDYDITTNARPEEVAKLFRRTVLVGAAFGVVRVLIGKYPHCEYEVATYRRDSTYSDGRHPDRVEYSQSKEEDVERRDFTINALLMDPFTSEVIDLVGGRADLERRVIRAVGDPFGRIAEDKLRMLRAVRFAARFGFDVEAATRAAILREAAAISVVSIERIVAELEGIFISASPVRGFDLLVETTLWSHVLPFAVATPALRNSFDILPKIPKEFRPVVAWALLLEGVDRAQDRMRDLKLSRADMRSIDRLLGARALLLNPEAHAEHERVRLVLDADRDLFFSYCVVKGGDRGAWERTVLDLVERPLPPLPVVTGDDLKALGIPPGRIYKDLLHGAEIEIFERRIKTRDEALAWLKAAAATSSP